MLMLKNLGKLQLCLIFIYFLWLGTHHLDAKGIFEHEDHCLAYQTEETFLLFIDSIVIGKTCEISIQVDRKANNTRFIVSFPISSLDSGVDMRDDDVKEILSFKSNTYIRFVSDFLSEEQVRAALAHGNTKLGGMLEIAGNTYKVIFPLRFSEQFGTWLVTGKLVSSFSQFGLELPSVLGGVIADTRDFLKLLVHLRFNLVQGLPEFNP